MLSTLLESVRSQTLRPGQVIVVDNGSTDGSHGVAGEYGAQFIELGENYGFCRAVNEGLRHTCAHWVAILNNDVELSPDFFEVILNKADGGDWLLAPRILRQSDHTRIDGTFDLISRSGCAWRAGHGHADAEEWRTSQCISFPSFTAGLFRRELFDRVGYLDECFESYLEDVDFGLRCTFLGCNGAYVPEAVAYHRGSATFGSWDHRKVRLLSRNQVFLVARHYPEGWLERYGPAVILGQLLWGVVAARRGAFVPWLQGKWEGIRRFSEMRASGTSPSTQVFDNVIRESENGIYVLQKRHGFDWYWRTYFQICGGPA